MANEKGTNKKEQALAPASPSTDQALAAQPAGAGSQYLALQAGKEITTVKELIQMNFGRETLNFSDLEKVNLPSGGGTAWEVAALEGTHSVQSLEGIIVAWADKKAWWELAFDEQGGGNPPDCRSEDMVMGIGAPGMGLNKKEEMLLAGETPEAQEWKKKNPRVQHPPKVLGAGFECATCVHNTFGSAAKGGGKACQDKRPIFMLDKESFLPFVIMAPATSIGPLKDYFKRMAKASLPFYAAITRLELKQELNPARIKYSVIVPTLVERLTGEGLEAAMAYSRMLMPMIRTDVMNQPGLYTEAEKQSAATGAVPTAPGADEQGATSPASPAS
jgi:hypothetical protein